MTTTDRFDDKTVLVTQAAEYMGPAIADLFEQRGATVVRSHARLDQPRAVDEALEQAEGLDILIANLALEPRMAPVSKIEDADWEALFEVMVHPLMRLVRGAAPRMIERGHGKIVAVTSAAPLRGIPNASGYCAARGAQNAFVRAAGLELARDNVQLNAIAQNYVRNEAYYPYSLVQTEKFQKHLARNVPRGRLAHPWETAELALFLASPRSDFIVGQIFPFAGGWVTST